MKMASAKVSIIAAMNEGDRAIGCEGKLLWKISPDLKRFKELTTGHPIIMGRKTFESIGRVLPNRTNIVITRNPEYKAEGAIVVGSLEEALQKANHPASPTRHSLQERYTLRFPKTECSESCGSSKYSLPHLLVQGGVPSPRGGVVEEIFIIGGGEIYREALPLADRLYLTLVQSEAEGDTFFPDYSAFKKIISEEKVESRITNQESRMGTETPPFRWVTLEK